MSTLSADSGPATASDETTRPTARGLSRASWLSPTLRAVLPLLLCLAAFVAAWALSSGTGTRSYASADILRASSDTFFEARKTDYTNNRAAALRRNAAGTVDMAALDGTKASALDLNLLLFGTGSARIEARGASGAVLSETVVDGSGRQLWRTVSVRETEPVATLALSSQGLDYLVVERITANADRAVSLPSVLLAGLPAAVVLALVLWVSRRFSIAPQTSSKKSWAYIDELRGVAIVLVLLLHVCGSSGLPLFPRWDTFRYFAYNGHYGVELFYLVSAFTLTLSLLYTLGKTATATSRGTVAYDVFMHNRVLRIVPVFVIVLALSLLMREQIVLSLREIGAADIARNVFLLHVFDQASLRNPIGHSVWWSIATEFQFYVLMPFIVAGTLALTRGWLALAVPILLLGGLAVSLWTEVALADKAWSKLSVFYHIDAFCLGIVLGLVFSRLGPDGRGTQVTRPVKAALVAGAWALLLCALAFPLGARVADAVGMSAGASSRMDRVVVLLGGAAVILCLQLFRNRPRVRGNIAYIGILSYVVYLVHIPVLRLLSRLPYPNAMVSEELYYVYLVILTLAGSLAVSLALHRLVEAPLLARFKGAQAPAWGRQASVVFTAVFITGTLAYLVAL